MASKKSPRSFIRVDRSKTITTLIGALASIIVAIIAGLTALLPDVMLSPPSEAIPTPMPLSIDVEIDSLKNEISSLQQDLDTLHQAIENSNANPDVAALNSEMLQFSKRLEVIEQAVLDNPEKALELTLFKKDIENIDKDIAATREEINRTFDVFKFLLGTIALGVFSLAVNNFIPSKRYTEKKENEKKQLDE